jgi:AraC-like DNA-binding protein
MAERPKADDVPRRITVRVHDYPEGNGQGAHAHRRGQLAGADRGTFSVRTAAGAWAVGPAWAAWVPPFVEHDLQAKEPLRLFSVYLDPEDCAALPDKPCLVRAPMLLREMIRRATAFPDLYDEGGAEGRFADVLIDQMRELTPISAPLRIPASPALAAVYDHLRATPDCRRSLEDWAKRMGLSRRTLSRRFHEEVGVGFRTWRTQLKLYEALERLAAGEPPTSVAYGLGYGSPSSLSQVFKAYLGDTPSAYVEAR